MDDKMVKASMHIYGAEHINVTDGVPKEGMHYGSILDVNDGFSGENNIIDYSTWDRMNYKKIPRNCSAAVFVVNTNIVNPELMCDAIDSCGVETDSMYKLKEKLELAIKKNLSKETKEKKKIILSLAEKYNISLEDLAKQQGKAVNKKNKVEPKYLSPNCIDTWTGRGRQPLWVQQYLEAGEGRNINDLTIFPEVNE